MGTCVVTDPSAVMPQAWLDALPLRIIPIDIAWPDGTTQPGDLSYSDVASRLDASPTPPTTGAPAPGLYAELIHDLLRSYDGVVIVCPSSELSTTFQSARLGADESGMPQVRVIDSKTAASGQGIVAALSARAAAAGDGVDVVAQRASRIAPGVQIWATLSQLDFLRRSGRVPAVAAVGAGALGLQPIVRYAGGAPNPVGVVRSAARGADRLFRAWERSRVDGAALTCVAFHAGRRADAEDVVGRICNIATEADAHVVEATASLASHTGAGILGLAWYWDLES